MVDNLSIDDDWKTNSTGSVIATGPALTADTTELYLRIESDITPAFSNTTEVRQSTFWYSTDCEEFTQLGPAYNMKNQWQFFSGYRFGVFNFATKALNGEITVKSFELELL
jgi:hypothetical protein